MSWITQLIKRRRHRVLTQTLRMIRLHSTPFNDLLANMSNLLKRYEAKFTFPIVGSVALANPELPRNIIRSGFEVAVHGFNHVRYTSLSAEQQEKDIKLALDAFRKSVVSVHGFRAPYNVYAERTPRLVEKYGFLWDIGIGYNPQYRNRTSPFTVPLDGHQSRFMCLPLNRWSDDLMIDSYGFNSRQIGETLKREIEKARENHGVVMFDLHPIRMGQPQYVDALSETLEHGTKLNGWFPSVSEAVEQWKREHEWKHNASFCCLLTGDIDTITIVDYIKRIYQ